jgi:hypothetical protein
MREGWTDMSPDGDTAFMVGYRSGHIRSECW